jgi:L-ribulose-5-phosphate 3-epimerase
MEKRKIGIMVPFFTEISMKDRLRLMKEAGFTSFMMSIDRNHEKFTDKLENIVTYCKELGLEIGSAHAPYKDPDVNEFWKEGKAGDEIEKIYFESLEFAKEHGIKTVVYHLHFENDYQLSKTGIERLERMTAFAEKHNINIAVENLYSYDEIDYIFSHIKSPNLGFCYDTGHENFLTPNSDIVFKYGNRLKALHLNDNDGKTDQHATIFTGTVNWDKISTGLAAANPIHLDAEIRIHRPQGVEKVSNEQMLALYKKEFTELSKLRELICSKEVTNNPK